MYQSPYDGSNPVLMCKSSGGNEVVEHQGTGALGGWFGRFGLRGRSIRGAFWARRPDFLFYVFVFFLFLVSVAFFV